MMLQWDHSIDHSINNVEKEIIWIWKEMGEESDEEHVLQTKTSTEYKYKRRRKVSFENFAFESKIHNWQATEITSLHSYRFISSRGLLVDTT